MRRKVLLALPATAGVVVYIVLELVGHALAPKNPTWTQVGVTMVICGAIFAGLLWIAHQFDKR